MVRAVYSDGKQSDTISELKASIIAYCQEIDQNTLRSLVSSMPDRGFE